MTRRNLSAVKIQVNRHQNPMIYYFSVCVLEPLSVNIVIRLKLVDILFACFVGIEWKPSAVDTSIVDRCL